MEWLRELKQILGDRIRLEEWADFPVGKEPFLHETEQWIPIGKKQYIVIDRNRLSGEAAELLTLLIEKGVSARDTSAAQWFQQLIQNHREEHKFVNEAVVNGWDISLPGVVGVLALHAAESEGPVTLLEEILSDVDGHALAIGNDQNIWFYLPMLEGQTIEDVKETCARLLDTLMSELYASGKVAIGRPAMDLQDLPRAKREAEVALLAGSAFRGGQKVYFYGQLGLAQLLFGITPEAKNAFLEEVLPKEKAEGLTQEFRETVHSFALHGQNISETARALFIHRNTLLYRLDKIQELTGRDIRRFEDLVVIWLALMLHYQQNAQ
ncbi:PucR family transcriptional regulator [Effusibacillus consociatus]|uniref:PucR family transcriptional regulator n=1 Tax=Effusibacillus consociatus TaxID=1117041 RepID=A0ABV9Q3H2_9BACL